VKRATEVRNCHAVDWEGPDTSRLRRVLLIQIFGSLGDFTKSICWSHLDSGKIEYVNPPSGMSHDFLHSWCLTNYIYIHSVYIYTYIYIYSISICHRVPTTITDWSSVHISANEKRSLITNCTCNCPKKGSIWTWPNGSAPNNYFNGKTHHFRRWRPLKSRTDVFVGTFVSTYI
jgi:hypothetical protein